MGAFWPLFDLLCPFFAGYFRAIVSIKSLLLNLSDVRINATLMSHVP